MKLVQYYLAKLAEEGAEVAQIALKTQHLGLVEGETDATVHPMRDAT